MDISALGLFEGYGIELEYMIVDEHTLDIKPIADKLLQGSGGKRVSEMERENFSWSNELVLHVIELKTNGPALTLEGLHHLLQQEVKEINDRLKPLGVMLMPAAMHPWMDPYREMQLWPHDYNPVYEAYNRIFDCRGHGWANLQSAHINLPFYGDDEFEKLHAAIRVLLPLLPAIAASSPIADEQVQEQSDYRLEVYRHNASKIPSVTGHVIPEQVFSQQEYDSKIFQPMYTDIAPHDPDQILQEEWLNSRGAIARFDRGSIEIRLLDVQECPLADLAIARIITDTLKALVDERWCSLQHQESWSVDALYRILDGTITGAENARIENSDYGDLFGLDQSSGKLTAADIWVHLFNELYEPGRVGEDEVLDALKTILDKGTLSTRIKKALPANPGKGDVKAVYRKLSDCLASGKLFTG